MPVTTILFNYSYTALSTREKTLPYVSSGRARITMEIIDKEQSTLLEVKKTIKQLLSDQCRKTANLTFPDGETVLKESITINNVQEATEWSIIEDVE